MKNKKNKYIYDKDRPYRDVCRKLGGREKGQRTVCLISNEGGSTLA